jgi:UDP-N-acetylmuramate: L-alanyl-gamma-D-glutamyl-meso-diaminopimelate ligase|tara:strand:- start:25280 stop:26680 length:1401 start_codon:yes stop_codon:yes gene_type:complete
MHVHILGICGTFMGSLAVLAKQLGYRVTGSDIGVYPPMSTQLERAGIELIEGFDIDQLEMKPDQIIVGNVMTRGHAVIEEMLERKLELISGPQWLAQHVLGDRWVLAVAGTHGKTTTASMLAWILEYAGLKPGFLIGGAVNNFDFSARLGETPFFVIEADEYDTAFFDKRSKFIHYSPRTLILNNLEFDHADIFRDLEDVQRQFKHLLKLMPASAKMIINADDENLATLHQESQWCEQEFFAAESVAVETQGWQLQTPSNDAGLVNHDAISFTLDGKAYAGELAQPGQHNKMNALAAMAAARHVGVTPDIALDALKEFRGVRRRMELKGVHHGVSVYDDFAHHPTAIRCTIEAFRERRSEKSGRLIVVLEPRSNSMQMGVHKEQLRGSLSAADHSFVFDNGALQWSLTDIFKDSNVVIENDIDNLLQSVIGLLHSGDNVLVLSNGGFQDFCRRLCERLSKVVSVHD